MRPIRVTAATTLAVVSLLPLATGAEAAVAAAGTATSTATLASISAVGTDVAIGALTASAGTTSGILSKVTLAPLAVNGTNVVPAVTVEPSDSPVTVPGASTPAALAAILAVSSPSLTISAAGGESPASGLNTTDGLGSVSVLGMDLSIDGALSVGSTVSKTKADAAKTLTVTDFALPSLADILGNLGIDLAALPVDVLNELVSQLPIDVPTELDAAIVAANTAIDAAQGAVDDAVGDLEQAQSGLNAAQSAKNAADAAVAAAQTAFEAALAAAQPVPFTPETWEALGAGQSAYPTIEALEGDLEQKTTDAAGAAAAVTTAQAALNTAQAALNTALAALQPLVDNLAGLVDEALDVPLVSLAGAQVGTLARVDAAKTAKIAGTVSGLKVLDADVLDLVTGNTTLDLAGAVTSAIAEVNAMAQGVMDDLSAILAGATGMVVPAPQVEILRQTTKTGTNGAFGTADAAVTVLSITMEPITLPEEFAIPFDELPVNIEEIASGVLQATGFDVTVGTLSEAASYRPAVLGPTTGPDLPATGAPYGVSLLAATVLGVGVLTRRRLAVAPIDE